ARAPMRQGAATMSGAGSSSGPSTGPLPQVVPWTRRALLRAALVAGAAACAPAPRAAAPPERATAPRAAGRAPPGPPAAAPTIARGPDVVRQGNVGTAFSTTIARVRGYFRDVGIDLQDETFASGAQQTPLLAADQLDVGTTSVQSAFFNA